MKQLALGVILLFLVICKATSDGLRQHRSFPVSNNNTVAVAELSFGQVEYVGNVDNDGSGGFFYSLYPMGVCQGDCDTDDDCQEGLYCYQRNGLQSVPFCDGAEKMIENPDFCTWNTSHPPPFLPPTKPPGVFQFKLYWEEGYLWQNETVEREWCMVADYGGYPGNGTCWYGREVGDCSPTQLYMGVCLDGDARQWFTMVDVGTTYTGSADIHEILLQTANPTAKDRCLGRAKNSIYLTEECNPADRSQRFFALSGSFSPTGSPDGKSRFEVGQYNGYDHNYCMTNAHHPKSGEVVEFHLCEEARKEHDETSYWELLI